MTIPFIVEPEELHAHLRDPHLRIIDLCNPQHYAEGHVPGALHVLPQELVAGTPPAPGKLSSVARLNELFSRLGLNANTHFVVYDDEGGGWAGRFIWTLDVIGHQHYSYLNGGLWAWRAANLPLSTDAPAIEATAVSVQINSKPMLDKAAILARLGTENFAIWDARSREEYLGLRNTAAKNGHIPGAVHCEWTELMDRNADLRIRDDARQYLHNKGFNEQQTIVTHCQTHHRSGFTYLVGKALGLRIKAYPGSWSEWGNSSDTPVEN